MAKCYAGCIGCDSSRTKEDHRLGSESAEGFAKTWKTTATAFVKRDGSGYVQVLRNGRLEHAYHFPAEEIAEVMEKL